MVIILNFSFPLRKVDFSNLQASVTAPQKLVSLHPLRGAAAAYATCYKDTVLLSEINHLVPKKTIISNTLQNNIITYNVTALFELFGNCE